MIDPKSKNVIRKGFDLLDCLKTDMGKYDADMAIELIHGGALLTIEEFSRTALMWAVYHDSLDLVDRMLMEGADPNKRIKATESGKKAVIGKIAFEDQASILHQAMGYHRSVGIIESLIKAGADVHATDGLGRTPLMYAAIAGREDLVNILFEHGAMRDVGKRDNEGRTAADHARRFNDEYLAQYIETPDMWKRTRLHKEFLKSIDTGSQKNIPVKKAKFIKKSGGSHDPA